MLMNTFQNSVKEGVNYCQDLNLKKKKERKKERKKEGKKKSLLSSQRRTNSFELSINAV